VRNNGYNYKQFTNVTPFAKPASAAEGLYQMAGLFVTIRKSALMAQDSLK
jgi:hypothetical protein